MERSPPTADCPLAVRERVASTWALSDGRAGNVRQADALAHAIDAGDVRSVALQPRWPWRLLAPRSLPAGGLAFGAAFASMLDAPPTLAVGCGRQAALATRQLRMRGARVVQVLDPRLDTRHWDLVVAPRHDALRGDNVIQTLGSLHPVDAAWLERARAQFHALSDLPRPRTAVLLGGSSRHVRFAQADLAAMVDLVAAAVRHDGGSILLTTSRRTPPALLAWLRAHPIDSPGVRWLGHADGANPYPGLLAWADRIACSPDSINMISEACATTVPVHVFGADRASGRLRAFLDSVQTLGRIRALDAVLAPFDVTPLRETARVATLVRDRLSS